MAGSLEGVLGRIPGLAGYLGGQQADTEQQMGQLQQVGALQGIIGNIQQQQQRQAALEKEAAFRTALGKARTPEEQAAVAAQFGAPKDILGHADRVVAAANAKEMALARLNQTAQMGAQTFALRAQAAKTAAERAQVDAEYKQFQSRVQQERLKYDTGATVAPFAPLPGATDTTQSNAAPQWGPVAAGTPPAVADAAAQIRANLAQGGPGGSVDVGVVPTPSAPSAAPVAPTPAVPNNLDARDLRLANATNGAPAPAPVAAPAAPALVMPPEIASAPKKVQDAWKLKQTGIAGGGQLSPDALKSAAEQYLAGDRQAVQGYARSAPARIALQNEIARQMKESGWTGKDVAAQMADFAGVMSGSRTVGTRAAQIELAASEAEKMIQIATDKSKAFERTQFVPVNAALKAYETNTGAPEVKAFGAAVNSLVNVYARAISPSGVPTVSDKDHAREMVSVIDSPEQFAAVMDVMRQEMKAARAAPGEVRAATRKAVTGGGVETSAAPAASKQRIIFDAQGNIVK